MKKTSTLALTLCGSGLLLGCSSMAPWSRLAAPPPMVRSLYDTADAAYFAGRQFHRQSRFNEAAIAYQDALTLDASHIETRNGLAVLVAGRGDLDRAIAILTELTKSQPDAPHILANLGYAYYLKGDVAAADRALDQAIKIAPDDEKSWGKLAAVLDQYRLAEPKAPDVVHAATEVDMPVDNDLRLEIAPISADEYALRYLGTGPQALPLPVPESVPVTAPLPALKTVTPITVADIVPLELSNGNGVRGLARSLRTMIKSDSWRVVRVINHDSFKVPVTRIEYADNYLPAARLLAEHIGVTAELRPHYRAAGAPLRVVLGHDFKSVEAMQRRHKNLPLACTSMMVQS